MTATTSPILPVIDETDAAVETLKFLSDGNRLRILKILSRRESCVCELIEQIGLAQPLVSYHLRKLRDAGLVRTRRKAQWVYYSIDPAVWRSLVSPLLNHFLVTEFPPDEVLLKTTRSTLPSTAEISGSIFLPIRSWPSCDRSQPVPRHAPKVSV